MNLTGYDKVILCVGLFFLIVALMSSCGNLSQGYIAPDKQMTEKNIYETFVKEGIIK
jgi:hypothetical protein